MNFKNGMNISNSRSPSGRIKYYMGVLLGLAVLLTACGETATIENVAFPIPTVTPLPGMTSPAEPTATPTQAAPTAKPSPVAQAAPGTQPSPVAQPANVKPAKPQALDRLPVVEGIIEDVATENNLSVLTVNKTRYTVIPEITSKIGKWFKVGNRIKMTGTRYSDGTNLITLVVNVTRP